MPTLFRAVATLALLTVAAPASAERPEISGAWIRATPPGARTAAAYLTIRNGGPADRLLGAVSPAARELQLHTQVSEAGRQRMVHLTEIPLPAGDTIRLEPGGLHLMLVDIAAPLAPGTEVELSLRFAAAAPIVIAVPVVDARAGAAPAHDRR